MKRKFVSLCFLIFGVAISHAQSPEKAKEESTEDARKPLIIAFPAAYYTPETEWGFGAGGVFNFFLNKKDTISPSSQIQLAGSYTLRKQVLFYLPLNFYWNEFKNVIESELGYYDYIYPFYGLGDSSLEENREDYSSRYFRLKFDGLRRVHNQTFVGVRYWLDTPDIYKVKEDGILENEVILGESGGTISGIGPQLRIDKRDNIYSPKAGTYLNTFFQRFSKTIGSEFNFSRFRVDSRKYIPLKKTTLAMQLYSDVNWGDVPFFQKARLGGTKFVRGFLEGRFIDDVSVNARVDVAFTPEGSNFYLTIGEAF